MSLDLVAAAGWVRSLMAAPVAAIFATGALWACAVPASSALDAGIDVRILVKLVRPSQDAAAIGADAARQSGVSARYAKPMSAAWHVIVLRCVDVAMCDAAIARMRQAGDVYEAVEPEGRKQPH